MRGHAVGGYKQQGVGQRGHAAVGQQQRRAGQGGMATSQAALSAGRSLQAWSRCTASSPTPPSCSSPRMREGLGAGPVVLCQFDDTGTVNILTLGLSARLAALKPEWRASGSRPSRPLKMNNASFIPALYCVCKSSVRNSPSLCVLILASVPACPLPAEVQNALCQESQCMDQPHANQLTDP